MGEGIISRSEYSFDLYHQVRDSSNSIHFVFGKYRDLLSFFFTYIHTLIEPRKRGFSEKKMALKRLKLVQ